MKRLVLTYIAFRTILLAFYNVYPLPGLRVTDLVGAVLPLFLLFYYFENRRPFSKWQKKILLLMSWAILSSLVVFLSYEMNFMVLLKQLFKILSGVAVYIAFPLIFKNEKDVNLLTNAFLISTIFPGLQVGAQYFLGANVLGLKADVVGDNIVMFSGVYGNYGVFGIISWIGSLCVIIKLGLTQKKRLFYTSLFILYLLIGFLTLSRTIVILMFVILLGLLTLLVKSRKGGIFILFILLGFIAVNSPVVQYSYEKLKKRSKNEIEVLTGERDIVYGMHGRIGRWDKNLSRFFSEYDIFEQMVGTDLYIGPHGDYFFWLFSHGFIGLLIYLSFIISLFFYVKTRLKGVRDIFYKYYGTAVFLGIIVWMIMAISTNPSFMPDVGYFILGNSAIFLSISKYRNKNSTGVVKNGG